jgi:hypothetical protein
LILKHKKAAALAVPLHKKYSGQKVTTQLLWENAFPASADE